jgi:signal transduction histidine kinase/ActR/RegA family two-component response regulator
MAPATAAEAGAAAPETRTAPRESEVRALLRILTTQAANSNPIVAVAAIVMVATLYQKVETTGLLVWAALAVTVAVSRRMISTHVRSNLAQTGDAQLPAALRVMVWGSACNSVVMGSAFWLIAATGDMYVRMIITLISMAHMMALLLYLLPGLAHRLFVSAGNVSQGLLFWLGIGVAEPAHWEVALVYGGLFWCGLVAGREQLRQFRESMRMRDENAALLARLEQERSVVQAALEEARLANAAKNRFLAAASHDLRQPLHALTMFLGTLGFHVAGSEGRRLLGRANDTVRVLDEQFNSLLDLSRFDAGAVSAKPVPFRLDELLTRVVDEFRPQAEHKGLGLAVSTVPAPVVSDPVLLGRLLRNLLDNAIHYTARGSVAARILAGAGGFALEIRDTGPGIPEHLQATVFDEYVQLDNPGRQRERGVGLGLAIVKRIDQLLGLQLRLRSVPGEGCAFLISVLAAAGEMAAPPQHSGPDPLSWRTSARIWILDDDETVLEGLRGQLQAWGARVATFSDPEQLLASLATAVPRPAWILTDDMLGARLSGLEVAEAVARQFAGTRVGLITGNTEPARLAQLRESGLPVIVKPATPERLMSLLAEDATGTVAAPTAA